MSVRTFTAGALALAVSALTATAHATPLELRTENAASAPARNNTNNMGWELAAFAAALAGAAYYIHKRRKQGGAKTASAPPALRIVSRTSVGPKSELLVVDIGEQRVLLGVTPSAIRHVADLEIEPEPRVSPTPAAASDVGPRFRALVDGALRRDAEVKQSGERPIERAARFDEPVEAQAQSLVAMRRR